MTQSRQPRSSSVYDDFNGPKTQVSNTTVETVVAPVVRPTSFLTREPVALQAVVQAALGLFIGFGLPVSTEQMGLVLVFTAAILALMTRQNVTPFEATGTNPNVDPNN